MASKPKRSSFPAGRSGAAKYQTALRKFNGSNKPAETPRNKGGGQGGAGGRTTRQTRRNASNKGPKKGDTKIVNNAKYTWNGTKWKVTGPPRTMTHVQAEAARTKPTPGSNPERGDAYRTGNRKTERQIAAAEKAKTKPPVKPPVKPSVKPPVKPPVKAPAKPTKPATKAKPSNQPANAGAGNGAPRPAEVKPAKEHHIKSSRLRDALKSVKKFKPKK